ncbi:MAG: hypothetical protein ABIA74_02900 [bacterium]
MHKDKKKKCGLCGKSKNLIRTECCNNWICDDEHKYVMFSFARNSCSRNHRRQTLCGFHYVEGHSGKWQTCVKCKESFSPEMYVYYGTGDYNFEQLPNPPKYKALRCAKCSSYIKLGDEECFITNEGYLCSKCGPF